jgi:hypothetical protein
VERRKRRERVKMRRESGVFSKGTRGGRVRSGVQLPRLLGKVPGLSIELQDLLMFDRA